MKRSVFVCALLLAAAVALQAQSSQSSQYEGVSNPPPDDTITAPMPQPEPMAKPSPAHPLVAPAQPAPASVAPQPSLVVPDASATADTDDGTDSGVVQVEQQAPAQVAQPADPTLNQRAYAGDPDGDIVHPASLPAGELNSGTIIRARLLDGLSTAVSQPGDTFRTQVASDVFRDNQILIPEGSEIDGTVVRVSSGHFAGHGSMLLRPQTVVLPDGSRFNMYAQVTGTPGSNTDVGAEGKITPGSRVKKDGFEYGGAAGAGAVTGAVVAGPAGALAGSIVGAGAVTVHLLTDHPEARLASGTMLDFTLTQPLDLVAAGAAPPSAQSAPSTANPPAAVNQSTTAGEQTIPDIE